MNRRTIRLSLAIGSAAALFAASAVGTASASAGGTNDPGVQSDPTVSTVAAATLEDHAEAGLGDRYGGAWLDGKAMVVATTDAADLSRIRAMGATARVVEHSEAELTAMKERLDANAEGLPEAVQAWGVDVTENELVVHVDTGSVPDAKRFVRASGVELADVRFVEFDAAPKPINHVQGGDAYYFGSGRCSIGLVVQGGFATAGHCGRTGTAVQDHSRQSMGSVAGSIFPGRDMAWVRVTGGQQLLPQVNRYPGSVPVRGGREAPVGTQICRSGSTNGWTCGTIQAKNQSVTYPEGTITGLTLTNACAGPGDSGGSWITPSDNQAQGVTSGGSGFCGSGQPPRIYFQPLQPLLSQFGLELMTDGDPPTTPPPTTDPPTTDPPGGTWQTWTPYSVGDVVTYGGASYRCRIAHTSLPGWEPPNTPALWVRM